MKRFLALVFLFYASGVDPQTPPGTRRQPGGSPDTGFLLPNGWTVTPAGAQIPVGDFPLALVLHPDGRHLLVSNNGHGPQSVDVIDAGTKQIVGRAEVDKAWLGLAVGGDGKRAYAGGGLSNSILTFDLAAGKITPASSIPLGSPQADIFPGGLSVVGSRLYVANNLGNSVSAVDLSAGKLLATVEVGDHPYTCVAAPDGKTVFASVWGAAQVAVLET